jgi:glycosyltransferase involved in cell wall biosynthesis
LEHCLRSILEQDYPDFEVVAVDDNSTDASAAMVTHLQSEFPHLRLFQPGPTLPGKKDALTAGIAAAHHERLLLTDADCAPASPQWISLMTAPLDADNDVVLGCSPYAYRPGWLNFWQRFEATYTALQYLGFARLGEPYMGVGRNLAYRKSFFYQAGGLTYHAHLPGGDDDLLINRHAPVDRTARVTDPAAWTYSAPTLHWRDYLRQKLRHQSVGPHYRLRHQLLLTTLALSHGLFYLLGLLLLFTPYWPLVLYCYVLRLACVYTSMRDIRTTQFLGGAAGAIHREQEQSLLVADLLLAPFYVFLLVGSLIGWRKW